MLKIYKVGICCMISLMNFSIEAKIITKKIEYKKDDLKFEGFLAYDNQIKEKVPAILIFHNWLGLSKETESKAIEFAKMGVVAFAGDIYGKDIRPKDAKEANELATKYKSDRALLRERVNLAFNELLRMNHVDTQKIVSAGYCFGGTAALELARSAADLKGVLSFHGGLSNPSPLDAKNMKGKVFIFHGAIDPYVKKEEIDQFQKEMNDAKVDYRFISFSNTVHSFTDKSAGSDISTGAAYNLAADIESWRISKNFITELKH